MKYLELGRFKVGFDFEKNTINMNGKSKRVVEDSEYIFKIQKTQIKAKGGINGLYEFMSEIVKETFGYGWFAQICKSI